MAENGILDYQGMNQAIYRGATSNIVVDTQGMSIEIGAGNTSHTSNLHFECNHDANVASIKLNSNVVTEFPRSKKLIKYPRVALTSAANNAYENGYKITTSSTSTWSGKYAFDGIVGSTSGSLWYTGELSHYTGTDGAAASTAPLLDTNTDRGQWLGIELPVAIKLQYFYIWQQPNDVQHFPKSGTIYAKKETNDPWVEIYRYDDRTRTHVPDVPEIFDDVNSEVAYKYFALVCTKRLSQNLSPPAGSGYGVAIGEWQLFGTPEYDPEAHGTDVVVKSVPNVPNTDWLEVYYDAKNYTNGVVQDETANNRDATLDGVGYDSVSKSFTFDGNDKMYTGVMTLTPTSSYTASLWFKVSELSSSQSILFQFGHGSGGESFGMSIKNGDLAAYVYSGSTPRTRPDLYIPDEWVHATCIANNDGIVEIYFNGRSVMLSDTGQALSIPTNPYLSLGIHFSGEQSSWHVGEFFKGSIANFRLFNRALTSDEIYQLYAYQKEYFGHGDLGMTLKAGRLGIGTSEPRAALDVRGDIFGPGIIQVQSTTFNGTASGTGTSFTTLSGLTTSITPKRAGSKILILLNLFWSGADDAYFQGNVKKDGTVLVKQEGSVGSATKTTFGAFGSYNRGVYALKNVGFSYLDDTNIRTEPIEYTIEVRNRAINAVGYMDWWINYTSSTNDANRLTAVSTLTLIEIQQ